MKISTILEIGAGAAFLVASVHVIRKSNKEANEALRKSEETIKKSEDLVDEIERQMNETRVPEDTMENLRSFLDELEAISE